MGGKVLLAIAVIAVAAAAVLTNLSGFRSAHNLNAAPAANGMIAAPNGNAVHTFPPVAMEVAGSPNTALAVQGRG